VPTPEPESRLCQTDGVFVVVLALAALLAVGGYYYLRYRERQARIQGVRALAQRLGFTFSMNDTEHVVDMPFALFSKGDGRQVELVCAGVHNNLPLRLFDYWYYDETSDGRGNHARSYHRFTCAILQIPAACPPLCLSHEDFMTRLGSHIGIHDVELEFDDFNKRFRVKCNEQKFAFTLLDGDMMQWLLDKDVFDYLEVVGPWVLLARDRLPPSAWINLGVWLDEFHAHVPELVYSTFPPS
jgi:hypothetical protein